MSLNIMELCGINEDDAGYRRSIYRMTASSSPKISFKDYVDNEFTIRGYCKFEDTEKKKVILSILTNDDLVLSGDSRTIQQSLEEFYDAFGDEAQTIPCRIIAAESKNNRTFLRIIAC